MDYLINHSPTRCINLSTVKQQLFNHQAISRADIARYTGLHRSTISSLFDELDTQGYIHHLGHGKSTTVGGRKPELYTFNGHYGYVACFNITYAHLYTMFLYVNGKEISFQRFDTCGQDIITVMELINRQLHKAANRHDTTHGLLGISISIHAIVDHNKVTHSPYYPMNGINFQQYFTNHYHVPVIVGNEANLAAIYERDYARHVSPANFIVLSIHRGPGIGVVANHHLFSGFQGKTGELGSVKVPNLMGQFQEIGDYLSVDHLQAAITKAVGINPHADYSTLKRVVATGGPKVDRVITSFAEVTGQLLFDLQMLYGPEEIFINSPLIELIPQLITKIKATAQQHAVTIPVSVISGSRYVSLLGAAAMIIRQVIELPDRDLDFKWTTSVG